MYRYINCNYSFILNYFKTSNRHIKARIHTSPTYTNMWWVFFFDLSIANFVCHITGFVDANFDDFLTWYDALLYKIPEVWSTLWGRVSVIFQTSLWLQLITLSSYHGLKNTPEISQIPPKVASDLNKVMWVHMRGPDWCLTFWGNK